jgi:hypothetical protein
MTIYSSRGRFVAGYWQAGFTGHCRTRTPRAHGLLAVASSLASNCLQEATAARRPQPDHQAASPHAWLILSRRACLLLLRARHARPTTACSTRYARQGSRWMPRNYGHREHRTGVRPFRQKLPPHSGDDGDRYLSRQSAPSASSHVRCRPTRDWISLSRPAWPWSSRRPSWGNAWCTAH